MVQPYLDGWIDLNIAVRRFPQLQVSAIERPVADGVYDYATKYLSGADGMESAPRELPADLPSAIQANYRRCRRDSCRGTTDQRRATRGLPVGRRRHGPVERDNPIPGAFGLYLWSPIGVDRVRLLTDLLAEAENQRVHPGSWNTTSDGTALRAASDIATKLA